MTVQPFLRLACHEFDTHFHHVEHGLTLYYALDKIRKDHDWQQDGKLTGEFRLNGEEWAICFDYDDQPILPWKDPSYKLEHARLYRLYVVAMDGTYDGERADRSQRVKGGTITIRPRWPDMQLRDEETGVIRNVRGYMDLGCPYVDIQVQSSNVDFERYSDLVSESLATFGVPRRYTDEPYKTSNINDAAVYARVRRDVSGPIYAADGPIARIHTLLESDRDGYRKHVEDNRERPGDYVTTTLSDDRAGNLIRGHRIGKEVKHYYMRDPQTYSPDEFGWHPKLEVAYQTSQTDETIYWDREDALDRTDLQRELEETLLNVLDWAGLDVLGSEEYHEDAYFDPDVRKQRSRKIVDCPLPEIESEQEHVVMRLWGDMTTSDRDLTELLLSDGGEISPQKAAEQTGYSYRTIRRAVDRLAGFVRHTYGALEIESDYAAQEMLKRVHAAEEQFRRTIETTTMQVAEDATGRKSGPFSRFKRTYEVGVRETDARCRKLLRVRYKPSDRDEALGIAREASTSYRQQCDDESGVYGIYMHVEYADGTNERIHLPDAFRLSKARVNTDGWRDERPVDKTRQKLLEDRERLPSRMKNRHTPAG